MESWEKVGNDKNYRLEAEKDSRTARYFKAKEDGQTALNACQIEYPRNAPERSGSVALESSHTVRHV